MKPIIKIFLICFTLSIPGFSQEVVELDLQKSLELALTFNHDLRLAELEYARAEELVDEAWGSALFPNISGFVDYQRALKRGEFIIETPLFSGSFPQGTENTLTVGANLEQPLFTAAVFLAVRVANIFADISKRGVYSARGDLIVNVKQAYYSYLLAKEVLKLSELSLELAEDNLKDTEVLFEAGIVPQYDFIRARVQVANLKPQLQDAEKSLILTANTLKVVTGIDLEKDIVIKDSLAFERIPYEDYDFVKGQLVENNFSLQQLRLQIELRDNAVTYEFSKHFPELYFNSSWRATAQENDPRPFNDWRYKNSVYIGLNLKVPIFNGFQTTSKVDQAKIDLFKAREEYEKSSKLLKNQLQDITLSIRQSEQKIEAYKLAIEEAQLGYEISVKRYNNGVGTQLEVVDALVSLTRTKVNYYSSVYEYYVLHAQLDKLIASDPLIKIDVEN